MFRQSLLAACAAGACFGGVSIASAGTIAFVGTRVNVDAPGPQSPRCGSRTTFHIRPGPNSTSVGASNLGSFVPVLSHCLQLPPPGPFDLGEFNFDFGSGNSIFGSYDGMLTATGAGKFNVSQTHLIAGGTGLFLNASGQFSSAGTLTLGNGPPSVQQRFHGFITAAGVVPEPASWALMIMGFGAVGAGLRRERRTACA